VNQGGGRHLATGAQGREEETGAQDAVPEARERNQSTDEHQEQTIFGSPGAAVGSMTEANLVNTKRAAQTTPLKATGDGSTERTGL